MFAYFLKNYAKYKLESDETPNQLQTSIVSLPGKNLAFLARLSLEALKFFSQLDADLYNSNVYKCQPFEILLGSLRPESILLELTWSPIVYVYTHTCVHVYTRSTNLKFLGIHRRRIQHQAKKAIYVLLGDRHKIVKHSSRSSL